MENSKYFLRNERDKIKQVVFLFFASCDIQSAIPCDKDKLLNERIEGKLVNR